MKALAAIVDERNAQICKDVIGAQGRHGGSSWVGRSEARCYSINTASSADGRSLRIGPTDKLDSDRWCTAHESTCVELSI